MEFCPTCKTLLKKSNNKLVCPKCEYVKKIDKPIKEKSAESDPDFLVMEESDMKKDQGLKSTIKIDCERNAIIKKEFGGVYKLVVLTNLKLDFIDV